MMLPLIGFAVTTSISFGVLWLFMRIGRNRDGEVLAGGKRRPLLFGALTEALAGVLPCAAPTRERLSRFLRQAGHYHRKALAEFLALRNAMVVGWVLLTAAAIVALTDPGDTRMFEFLVGGLIVVALLYSMPRLVLESMAKGRVQRIEEGLPDALDMVTMCMSGGLPLPGSLTRVSEEMKGTHPDLAFELRIVARQTEAGSLDSAIHQFAKRMDVPEIHSLAAMVAQTERQGAGVASALEGYADNVRLNRRQRAEEMGNKTAIKLLFPLVFCLAPPVYLMLISPAVIEIADFIKRENAPGGALSASPDNMRPILADNPAAENRTAPDVSPAGIEGTLAEAAAKDRAGKSASRARVQGKPVSILGKSRRPAAPDTKPEF